MAVNQRTSALLNSTLRAAQLTWELGRIAAHSLPVQIWPSSAASKFTDPPPAGTRMSIRHEAKKAQRAANKEEVGFVFLFCCWVLGLKCTPAVYQLVVIIN